MSNENIRTVSSARESIGVGSIVELKSGGPPMTVKSRTSDEAMVYFHDAEGGLYKEMIPLCCLKVRG
jgi:uncharacterized protein YodC (DUF2158 family)